MQNMTLWSGYPTQLNENFHMVMVTITPLVTPIRIFLIIMCILLSLLVLRCAWVVFMEVVDGFRTYCMPRSVVVEPPPFDLEAAAHFVAPPFLDTADCSPLCQEGACCEEQCPGDRAVRVKNPSLNFACTVAAGGACCSREECGYENPCWREKQNCPNERNCSSKETKRIRHRSRRRWGWRLEGLSDLDLPSRTAAWLDYPENEGFGLAATYRSVVGLPGERRIWTCRHVPQRGWTTRRTKDLDLPSRTAAWLDYPENEGFGLAAT
ncbi:hypothetical protein PRIPAC_76883 [Pristionchus pacificus]|uniref:4Fe-4S ferredoxin-type domain-containing protein n=1 Tax=Pristionchus pacificus TaxID=54126 RepID=A0A2A6BHP9_PRIPA|nr:hypothetical protein PRIPAC_76883 [Pristionchus pacificus]|eukprot:PDM65383.1 hypothetical protein PRIPAC_52325 [Pristionchus pacificus]